MSFGGELAVSSIVVVLFLLPTTYFGMACEIIPAMKHEEVFMRHLKGKSSSL